MANEVIWVTLTDGKDYEASLTGADAADTLLEILHRKGDPRAAGWIPLATPAGHVKYASYSEVVTIELRPRPEKPVPE
jgi:hypothetical protein